RGGGWRGAKGGEGARGGRTGPGLVWGGRCTRRGERPVPLGDERAGDRRGQPPPEVEPPGNPRHARPRARLSHAGGTARRRQTEPPLLRSAIRVQDSWRLHSPENKGGSQAP